MWLAGALTLALLLAIAPMGALAQGESAYVVQAGDWLAKIAAQKLGDWKLYPAIVLATQEQAATDNSYASVTDSWLVEPGWKLSIPSAEDAQGGLTVGKLENAEYPSELTQSGTAKLVDGEYSEAAAPDSASKTVIKLYERMAFGHSDGTPMAAVLLYGSGGGSGTFWDLHAVLEREGQAVPVAVTSLGDRVQIESLAVEGSEIVVRMVTHGPNDPMCCPTQKVLVRYALQGDQLVETAREGGSGQAGASAEIVGVTWEWEKFTGGDDSVIEVNDPTRYTLLLQADGTYALRADCNQGSGSYTLEGSSLTLAPGPMTLAACPEDSLDSEFLKDLEGVRTYVMNEGKLVLNLFADAGNMIFRPAGAQ